MMGPSEKEETAMAEALAEDADQGENLYDVNGYSDLDDEEQYPC